MNIHVLRILYIHIVTAPTNICSSCQPGSHQIHSSQTPGRMAGIRRAHCELIRNWQSSDRPTVMTTTINKHGKVTKLILSTNVKEERSENEEGKCRKWMGKKKQSPSTAAGPTSLYKVNMTASQNQREEQLQQELASSPSGLLRAANMICCTICTICLEAIQICIKVLQNTSLLLQY